MSSHLTPVEVCERVIGGIEQVATAGGRHPKSAYQWRHASGQRAAGDLPNPAVQRAILEFCRANGLPMQPEWLINGLDKDELAAALAAHARAA